MTIHLSDGALQIRHGDELDMIEGQESGRGGRQGPVHRHHPDLEGGLGVAAEDNGEGQDHQDRHEDVPTQTRAVPVKLPVAGDEYGKDTTPHLGYSQVPECRGLEDGGLPVMSAGRAP